MLTALLVGTLVAGPWAAAPAGAAETASPKLFVVAHRGDSAAAPESTIPAFSSAIRKGADAIEFDVRFTADGVAVAMHDETVDRTTNCHGAVATLSRAVIEACDAGSWFGAAFRGTRVPTVAEALTFIHRNSSVIEAFLHINTALTPAQAQLIVAAVGANDMTERVHYILEDEKNAATLQDVDVPFDSLGRMVHQIGDWALDYTVLVPYSDQQLVVSPALVRSAVLAGKLVLPVEDRPESLKEIIAGGANGVYLDRLSAGLSTLAAQHLH
jgi:glycerophosphoryl diester phosphodiesterase